jgi:serine/threonine-protein kinase
MGADVDIVQRAQERVGMVLRGKYTIDRVLGVGGMAVVYAATHRNQKQFAVKLLHPELSIQADLRSRFLREGYAANSVKHAGAVAVMDDDVAEDGAAFLVMELLEGESVEALLGRGTLAVHVVLAIADQLLDVLAAAHAKGIVHRDIKPANLFALRDGTLKVLDFGIARVKDAAAGHGGHATGTGMLLGTPAYMAPEQAFAKASEIDAQTDVWAVGATLFTMLTGRSVHEGENAAQLLVHAATVQARPVAASAPGLPVAVASVVDRALAFHKSARWATAAAMREAVQSASAAVLGHRPRKEDLALLLGSDAYTARTEPPPTGVAPGLPGLPGFAAVPMAPPMTTTNGPIVPGRIAGATTAQPVSTNYLPPGAGSRRTALATAIALAVPALLLAGGLAIRASIAGRQGLAAAATSTASGTTTAVAATRQAAMPEATIAYGAAPSDDASPSAPADRSTSQANNPPAPAEPASTKPGPRAPRTTTASSATPSAAPVASAPPKRPVCDPPYVLDAEGNKHFKPECFQR